MPRSQKLPERIQPYDLTRYRHIRPIAQMPNFAARIEGVDLSRPLAAEVKAELYQALLDFEVLLLPAQELVPEQHADLASAFGDVNAPSSFFPRKGDKVEVEIIEYDEKRPPELNNWHSDVTWVGNPPTGTVIQITELPSAGGNTAWASMSKAYAALSDGFKQYLDALSATHTWENSLVRDALADKGEDALVNAMRKFKPVVHPVVRIHPETGKKVLFVNETFTRHINDVHFRESRSILSFLYEWIVQPEFVYSHKWEKNGIAVWDNRTTQHYALADYWPHRRTVQRITFNAYSDAVSSPVAAA